MCFRYVKGYTPIPYKQTHTAFGLVFRIKNGCIRWDLYSTGPTFVAILFTHSQHRTQNANIYDYYKRNCFQPKWIFY